MILLRIGKLLAVAALGAVAWQVMAHDATDPAAVAPPGPGAPLWHAGRAAILAAEALLGLVYSGAALAMLRRLRGGAAGFGRARRFTLTATLAALALWFAGVLAASAALGDPWQAPVWAAPPAALRLFMAALMVLLFVNQPDAELPRRAD